ncbi:MAG: OmpA family protein [Bacteroidales bacterium]|nr:OmpA family protein [Bacteroidales bacterium]
MKKLVMTLALMLVAGTMFAQEVEKGSKQRWRNFETNRFVDNWELSVGAGIGGYYVTPFESDANYPDEKFQNFTFPTIDLALGKWITPILGARLGGYYGNYVYGYDVDNKDNNHKVNYWGIHLDGMVNFTNWICRYKADRFFNLIGFAGFGYAQSKQKELNEVENEGTWEKEIVCPVGLIARFRLCDAWTFNVELRDQISRPSFDNQIQNGKFANGNLLSATAGFTWKFSKVRNFNAYTPIDKSLYDNRISALERDLQAAQDQNSEYQKQIERYKKQLNDKERELQEALRNAAKTSPVVSVNDDVTLSIFFPLGSSEISDKNEINIKYMADVIKASKKSYTITGYADASTGSENRNMELSQQRAEAVYNALLNAGVDKSQIKVDYKGCSVQPFDKDYLNRVAIIK